MAVNIEGIYAKRRWKIAGSAAPPVAGNTAVNERNRKDLTAADVRYTTKSSTLYAFVMGWPEKEFLIKALAWNGASDPGNIRNVELLGHKGKLQWKREESGLRVEATSAKPSDYAVVLKVALG